MNAKDFQTKSNNTFERQWVKKFNVLATEMKARRKVLFEREKVLDKRREECLHFLELEKPNAAIRAKVTKILTDLSQERRMVKEELSDLQAVANKIKNIETAINETVDRGYQYSDDFLTEVFGDGE